MYIHLGIRLVTPWCSVVDVVQYPWYFIVDVVQNIYRRYDLSIKFCNCSFKSQALPLQVRILHSVLQHAISHKKRHGNEVRRLDVASLESILMGKKLNVGYIILYHMLSTPGIATWSLLFGSIIACLSIFRFS